MRFAAYPKYKPSGVEWLGDVPEHWHVKRLKRAATLTDKKVEADEENPVPYIGMENIESWTGQLLPINPDTVPTGTANEFKAGNTLFGKLRPYLAKACNPDFDGLCSTELLVLEGAELDRRALLYLLLTDGFVKLVDSSTYGSKMPRASWDFVGDCVVPIASADEQRAITDFLDRETAKIDTLVAKKRTLIERLKEKRTALISHTVTRGLPPDAARAVGLDPHPKLKPSGIDWLGDVPEHWVVSAVWHLFFLGRGRVISHEDISDNPGEFPVYSSQTENNGILGCLGSFDFDGDYITWTTDGANAGTVFRRFGRFNCTNVCGTLKPKSPERIETRFCAYALGMATGEFVRHDINPKLMNNVMAKIRIGVPPKKEQCCVSDFLDRETVKIDAMVAKVEAAIERLQEYRTALITAAVTGQIDLREVA